MGTSAFSFALLLLTVVLSTSGAQHDELPVNASFSDRNQTNIASSASTDDSRSLKGTKVHDLAAIGATKLSEHKKYVFSKLVHPMLHLTGLSNGGLYGAQYYGLAQTKPVSWKVPFFNYPNYNYQHPWLHKVKTKSDFVS